MNRMKMLIKKSSEILKSIEEYRKMQLKTEL